MEGKINLRPMGRPTHPPVTGLERREPRRPIRLDGGTGVILQFVGDGMYVLRGPRSGRTYQLNETGDLVLVHPDDVDELLRMRTFARER